MITAIIQRKKLIIFNLKITFLGLITGYNIYSNQSQETKTKITEKLNIKENLSYKTNNILKDLKDILIILIFSILIIPNILNIFNLFYKSLIIGFLISILSSINIKLTLIYITLYKLIPYIFLIFLTTIGIKISKNIIKYIINKSKENKHLIIKRIKLFTKVSFILITYEFILFLYSEIINKYLITLLNIM